MNAVLLGSLLYPSRLVPRWLPVLGFIGAVLLVTSCVAVLLGLIGAVSPVAAGAALPIAVWEFSLGVYLTVMGLQSYPDNCRYVKEPLPPSTCDGGSGVA